ncbi:MAG: metal transporter substrate-binding protein [Proteobacteria bacterium]|nr:metal transporter substrate-binding protein [Pseudomonadota bacterium]
MSFLKKLAGVAVLLTVAFWSTPILATTVLAGHPVVYALASDLVAGSPLKVLRAAPENIPPTRLTAYLTSRGEAAFAAAAREADAVITLRSLWPEDPLYPLARRSHIRIVEIDAAQPIDGALPGIALQAGKALPSQPWLDPVNLGRMADILANELGRLEPAAQPAIATRLASIKRRLINLSARNEAVLSTVDNAAVARLSERLDYLIGGLNLDQVALPAAQDRTAWLATHPVAALVTDSEPDADWLQAAKAAGIPLLVLDPVAADPLGALETMSARLIGSLHR